MVITQVLKTKKFEKQIKSLRDQKILKQLKEKILKIIKDPQIGKPLRFPFHGERSMRVEKYRLLYAIRGKTLLLLRFQHRKDVYR